MDTGPGTRSHSGLFGLLTGLMRGQTGAPGTRPHYRRRRMRTQAFLAATALVVVLLAVGVLSASANPLLPLGPLDVGDTYTLTYAAGAHGSISGESPQTVAYRGERQPGDGRARHRLPLRAVERRQSTANPSTDTNVQGDVDVTATFAIDTFSLTYAAGAHGSITGDDLTDASPTAPTAPP